RKRGPRGKCADGKTGSPLSWGRTVESAALDPLALLRGAFAHQRGGGLVVVLLAREQRLEADQAVIVLERDEMLLTGRERVAPLEDPQHVAHRVGGREQRDRREGCRDHAGVLELLEAACLWAGGLRQGRHVGGWNFA